MYESKNDKLLDSRAFGRRMLRHFCVAGLIIGLTLSVGVAGQLLLEPMAWHDAVLNTSLILAGIGPYIVPSSVLGKVFFSIYGMCVGLVFVATLGLVLAPLVHRMAHKFHLDED